jgi:hypothetical protein
MSTYKMKTDKGSLTRMPVKHPLGPPLKVLDGRLGINGDIILEASHGRLQQVFSTFFADSLDG